jgi:hypothetical protein
LPPEEHSSDNKDETQAAHYGSVVLGLIPAPEMPQRLAEELSTELPELLSEHVDDRVSWEVSVVCEPLTGSEPDAVPVIDAGRERMLEETWDLAICITDLPLRKDERPVVAAVSTERKVAVLSLPPLGVTLLLRRRVREAIVQLVDELYEGSSRLDRVDEEIDAGANAGEARRSSQRPRCLLAAGSPILCLPSGALR